MSTFLKYLFAPLLLLFISCNPDEDLDNTGNNGNPGNNGNTSDPINYVSYPEIVNLLAGDWYGDSIMLYTQDGNVISSLSYGQTSTASTGFLSFGTTSIGNVDYSLPAKLVGIIQTPPYEDLSVAKYAASVTTTNGSWSGTGGEQLMGELGGTYAIEGNLLADKSYCIVKYTTPFFNLSTPTIHYAVRTNGGINTSSQTPDFTSYFSDIRVGSPDASDQFGRIHTLNGTTLKIVTLYGGGSMYHMFTFKR
jgi:hypothetical protein